MTITIIAPPQADAAAPAPGNRPGVAHIDPNMKLVTGTFCSASEDWFEEPLERGLRLILVQSGQLRCRIPGQPEHLIEGPSLCTIANDGDFTSAQIYGTDKPLRYTIVQLGVEALDSRLGWLPEQLIRRPGGDPRIMSCPAPRAMQALASQIATCQMLGPTRDLYLGGKALELAALSAQFLSGEGRPVEEPRITCSEVERIHAARDLLVGALQEPPSLDTLASRVGMNPRKLTAGFRKVFGASVFGYLQEYRLREAHRTLERGGPPALSRPTGRPRRRPRRAPAGRARGPAGTPGRRPWLARRTRPGPPALPIDSGAGRLRAGPPGGLRLRR